MIVETNYIGITSYRETVKTKYGEFTFTRCFDSFDQNRNKEIYLEQKNLFLKDKDIDLKYLTDFIHD